MKKLILLILLMNASAFAAPVEVKFQTIEVQGQALKMAYREVIPAKSVSDVPVLLLHGKNFSGFYYEQTMNELAAQGYRVIAPDQIGFGQSSRPDLKYSFHLLATLTRGLLDQLKVKKVTVLGHSMGGMVATRFTLMFSERVQKLVLENPIGLEDYRLFVPYTRLEESIKTEEAATEESMAKYQRTYYTEWKPAYEAYVKDQSQWIKNPAWKTMAKSSALTYEMIYSEPVVYEFSKIKVPTLLIIGQADRTVVGKNKVQKIMLEQVGQYPSLGRKTKQAIWGSTLVEIQNCGHIPHVEKHEEFMKALLGFLKN